MKINAMVIKQVYVFLICLTACSYPPVQLALCL